MDINMIHRERQEAKIQRDEAEKRYEMADAYIGLDSLLKGAWGTENVDALGGGRGYIEKAHKVLGELLEEAEL